MGEETCWGSNEILWQGTELALEEKEVYDGGIHVAWCVLIWFCIVHLLLCFGDCCWDTISEQWLCPLLFSWALAYSNSSVTSLCNINIKCFFVHQLIPVGYLEMASQVFLLWKHLPLGNISEGQTHLWKVTRTCPVAWSRAGKITTTQ